MLLMRVNLEKGAIGKDCYFKKQIVFLGFSEKQEGQNNYKVLLVVKFIKASKSAQKWEESRKNQNNTDQN